jgi:quercetin dioxygenase-like cupin family protein
MKIQIIHPENAPKVAFNLDFNLDGKIMYKSDKSELIHLTLKPGEQIDKHLQPFDVIFYVLAGQGILETEEENFAGTENTAIFVPSGLLRSWKNNGTTDFKVLVYKDLG